MRAFHLLAVLALAGCGGGDVVGPPPPANVAGAWTFNWTNMAATVSGVGAFTCSIKDAPVSLTQTGSTFAGQLTGDATASCSGGGQTETDVIAGGAISNGVVNGDQVSFNLATTDASQIGTVSGSSMGGAAHWRLDLGSPYGVVRVDGKWSAVRAAPTAGVARSHGQRAPGRLSWVAAIARALAGH